jgi:cytochrome c553
LKKSLLFTFTFLSFLHASDGETLYKHKCQNCHGNYGQLSALGHSEAIMGWSIFKVSEALFGYKNGLRNTNGMGNYMSIKMKDYSDEDIKELAKYISSLKKEN